MARFAKVNEQNARLDIKLLCEKIQEYVLEYEETGNRALLGEIRECLQTYGGFWNDVKDDSSTDDFNGYRKRRAFKSIPSAGNGKSDCGCDLSGRGRSENEVPIRYQVGSMHYAFDLPEDMREHGTQQLQTLA